MKQFIFHTDPLYKLKLSYNITKKESNNSLCKQNYI
jgi:hypothetical protein